MLFRSFRDPPAIDPAAAAKFLVAENAPRLVELAAVLEKVTPWTTLGIEAAVEAWLARVGLPIKEVAQPARVALTGRTASPGLFDVIAVLGRAQAIARLRAAASAT